MFDLGGQKLDGVGQVCGGQDFLADVLQHFLRGPSVSQALAQDAEEIRLLDVFFAVENRGGGHTAIITDRAATLKKPVGDARSPASERAAF